MELLEWLTPESKRICHFVNNSLQINGMKIPDVSRHAKCLATNKLIQNHYMEVTKEMKINKSGGGGNQKLSVKKIRARNNGKNKTTR